MSNLLLLNYEYNTDMTEKVVARLVAICRSEPLYIESGRIVIGVHSHRYRPHSYLISVMDMSGSEIHIPMYTDDSAADDVTMVSDYVDKVVRLELLTNGVIM